MSIYPHKTLPYEPYVYFIGWSQLEKFYIGSSYGIKKNAHPSQLWTTYFTSSKLVKEFREVNGEPDIIRIEKIFTTVDDCRTYEIKLLKRMNLIKDPRFFNRSIGGLKFVCINHSEETRLKMSLSRQNVSQETRLKMSLSRQNVSQETREKIRRASLGRSASKETIEKRRLTWQNRPEEISKKISERISENNRNRIITPETKLKMSISAKNRKRTPMSNETKEKISLAAKIRHNLKISELNS